MHSKQHEFEQIGIQLLKTSQLRLTAALSYNIKLATDVMDPETLVTFLFRAPPEVRTVELLGSWDNFTRPYQMHHDRRRDTGFWSGCFKFENIIFDGEYLDWNRPRTGGLKQGGRYWFYYRLNGEVEAYDDLQEYTTRCPLLPGQTMNVIDVPTEILPLPSRARSASADIAGTLASMPSMHTMEPATKFAALEPPPLCKVHQRCVSDLAINGRLENHIVSPLSPPDSSQIIDRPTTSHGRSAQSPSPMLSPTSGSAYSNRSWHTSDAASTSHTSVIDAYASSYSERASSRPHRGPQPLEDVQCPASRPGTSRGEQARRRPRLYSIPNLEIDEHTALSSHPLSPSLLPADTSTRSSPVTDTSEFCSPTFSAATVSSGGLYTPFRLSAGYSRRASENDDSVEDVAKRLRTLDTTGSPSDVPEYMVSGALPPELAAYALPAAAVAGNSSLAKPSSTESGLRLPLPTVLHARNEVSMADAILSELGYLGGSIY